MTAKETADLTNMLSKYHNRAVHQCYIENVPESLHTESGSRSTILVKIMIKADHLSFQPGDHVGILAENRKELVNGIVENLITKENVDDPMQLQILKEIHTSNGIS